MASTKRGRNAGIEIRHPRSCAARKKGRCGCSPRYRAEAYDSREGKRVYKNFGGGQGVAGRRAVGAAHGHVDGGAQRDARRCRRDVARRRGQRLGPQPVGRRPQAECGARLRPGAAAARPAGAGGRAIRGAELQALVDRLLVAGHNPSTIRNTLLPVRAIFRRAVARGEVAVNPTRGLELPAVRGRRERIVSPEEARRLLDALERDRALWATALYSGLRMGELRALEWDAVDFDRGLIHVRRTWDHKEGPVEPKSRAGRRSVPLAPSCAPTSRRTASRASGATASSSAARPTLRSTPARSTTALAARGRRPASCASHCTSAATRSRR
ncbi:MAG TPA: tyrosine-type recombinase/integrase [Solirubrobacteraceae bacterium]|jgi:integrase